MSAIYNRGRLLYGLRTYLHNQPVPFSYGLCTNPQAVLQPTSTNHQHPTKFPANCQDPSPSLCEKSTRNSCDLPTVREVVHSNENSGEILSPWTIAQPLSQHIFHQMDKEMLY